MLDGVAAAGSSSVAMVAGSTSDAEAAERGTSAVLGVGIFTPHSRVFSPRYGPSQGFLDGRACFLCYACDGERGSSVVDDPDIGHCNGRVVVGIGRSLPPARLWSTFADGLCTSTCVASTASK